MLTVIADMDSATVEGILIPRPRWMARAQWLDFWEAARDIESNEKLRNELRDLKMERDELERTNRSLQDDINSLEVRLGG